MTEHLLDYKELFLQEQCWREFAELKQKEAEMIQRNECHRCEEAEARTRKTMLPEFFNARHHHLHLGLAVQTDASLSTRGDSANANNKLRSERLRVWDDIMEPGFA
ncbi:uncharacterized protein EKO05_0001073 [Ascochyta rabiei]|uniref:ATP binding n=1 Tax=Didymella rabiei TaxID=5454 RepID=A0A162WCR4_DIDRA|nr:uncharacterized protein EKO05_0001073 [Ascochyta rabiei]KZM18955.1 ATP binding [Ascochyta rabiei]UPX10412.1 hypothetical protein EKO05_0001073 [Ascochyta rabiei]